MLKNIAILIIFFSSVSFSLEKPEWVFGKIQHENFKFYGVGSAKKHINGKNHQKKLALKRAIDELAMQKESIIENNIEIYRKNEMTIYREESSQRVENIKVKSKIIESWEDPQTKEIFILVGGD